MAKYSQKTQRFTWNNMISKVIYGGITSLSFFLTCSVMDLVLIPVDYAEREGKRVAQIALTELSGFSKAAKAFYSEYRRMPSTSKDIGEYVTVLGCEKNSSKWCRNNASKNYSEVPLKTWISSDGRYRVIMNSGINTVNFIAVPLDKNWPPKQAASSCFNSSTNIRKVKLASMTKEGIVIARADCTTN